MHRKKRYSVLPGVGINTWDPIGASVLRPSRPSPAGQRRTSHHITPAPSQWLARHDHDRRPHRHPFLPPHRPWPRRRLARPRGRLRCLLRRHRRRRVIVASLGRPSSGAALAALARRVDVSAWCEARPLTLCELSLPGLCVSSHFQGGHTTCDISLCVTSRLAII